MSKLTYYKCHLETAVMLSVLGTNKVCEKGHKKYKFWFLASKGLQPKSLSFKIFFHNFQFRMIF